MVDVEKGDGWMDGWMDPTTRKHKVLVICTSIWPLAPKTKRNPTFLMHTLFYAYTVFFFAQRNECWYQSVSISEARELLQETKAGWQQWRLRRTVRR